MTNEQRAKARQRTEVMDDDSTFTLSIDMGNDAMQTVEDIADELEKVVQRLRSNDSYPGHTRSILDANGNRVGNYRVPRVER